jgi:hypothetical protein
MPPKGNHRENGKLTTRAIMPTSVMNECVLLNRDRVMEFISEGIRESIWIYNVYGINDERALDLFCDLIFLEPVRTAHFSQFQHVWTHCSSRSSPFREWWVAFCSYMGQMFGKTRS